LGFFSSRGADKYLGYLKQGVFFSRSQPNKQEINEAKTFAISIIENFTNKTELNKQFVNNKKNIIYNFESLFTNRTLINNIYSKLFSVNKNCISCGKCVEECPQDNITLDIKKSPQWSTNCELCLLCEMVCPFQAINSVVDMKIFQPILNYNVKKGLKDNNIDHIKIEYKDGEIIELN
jgi:ferredoxin